MQMDKIEELRKEWGTKPCDHPNVEKEYYLGAQTGDYACTQCGRTKSSKQEFNNDNNKKGDLLN